MNWLLQNKIVVGVVAAVLLLSWAVAGLGGGGFTKAVDNAATQGVPVMVGLIFAAIAIYVSILISLYGSFLGIANTRADVKKDFLLAKVNRFSASAAEAKQNAFLLIGFMVVGLASPMMRTLSWPDWAWPFKAEWLTSQGLVSAVNQGLTAISLAMLVLSVLAIVDTIRALFASQEDMAECTKVLIETAKPGRTITLQLEEEEEEEEHEQLPEGEKQPTLDAPPAAAPDAIPQPAPKPAPEKSPETGS